MRKKHIITRIALWASLIMLLTSTVQTTFGFIVAKTDTLVNTFSPFETIVSNMRISKTVEHKLGSGYVIPDNIAFDFKVDLGSLYANTTIKTTDGNKTADKNGVITLSVKPNSPVQIEGIDAGTKVAVTELQKAGNGFSVKDTALKEVTVSEEGIITVGFTNIYTPAAADTALTLNGTKILEGRNWAVGDSFSFLLEQSKDCSWVSLGTKTVTYDAENINFNKFDFSDIISELNFDKVGTYAFRISEIEGTLENVDYDKTVNYFSVRVGDNDMDGKLEIQDVTAAQNSSVTKDDKGIYNIAVTFNNTFIPVIPDPDDIEVSVTVDKTVIKTGDLDLSPEGFQFVLQNMETNEKTAFYTDENGKIVFKLPYTSADIGKTFKYTLRETNDGKEGVTYDEDVYNIDITISLGDDNKLLANMALNGEAAETLVAKFENTYHMDVEDAPPTGIDSHLTLWLIMLAISGTSTIILFIIHLKYRKSAKH